MFYKKEGFLISYAVYKYIECEIIKLLLTYYTLKIKRCEKGLYLKIIYSINQKLIKANYPKG